jgi:3-methyladenine DNA glycosylase/8-oxoguanine DNA glycosylase
MPTQLRATSAGDGVVLPAGIDLRRTLGWYRHGRIDPTTRLDGDTFVRAGWTPDGPATVRLDWSAGVLDVAAWGPGAAWAARAAVAMTGLQREPAPLPDVHPLVTLAAHRWQGVRTGASGDLYGALLPTILEQRITAAEAKRQHAALCHALGEPAPGPFPGLLLPPRPERLARRPAWWFHPFGIETKRARALVEVARVADHLWDWATLPSAEVAARLGALRGVGPWTIGSVLGPVCGDDDAVPVGDLHIPNLVAFNLAGEARADDARMLALLEPFRGQRGRVIRLLGFAGRRAPAFGPRRRILPMHRW